MGSVAIGIDVAKKVDRSAIAVVESLGREQGMTKWALRQMHAWPVGTNYDRVVEDIAYMFYALREQNSRPKYIWVDATGVGSAFMEMLQGAKIPAIPCHFTGGDKRIETMEKPPTGVTRLGRPKIERVSVGKEFLVSRLLSALESNRIVFSSNTPRELRDELESYERNKREGKTDELGGRTEHDDMATALMLAIQKDISPPRYAYEGISLS